MASAIQQVYTYWSGNSTLTALIPLASVYVGIVPPSLTSYPYAALNVVSSTPILNTSTSYIEEFRFSISIYSQNLDALETLATNVDKQFNKGTLSGMSCQRTNRITFGEAPSGLTTYRCVLEYLYDFNASLS